VGHILGRMVGQLGLRILAGTGLGRLVGHILVHMVRQLGHRILAGT